MLVLPELAIPVVGKVTCFLQAAVEYSWSHFQDRPQRGVAVAFLWNVRIGAYKLLVCQLQEGSSALPPCQSSCSLLSRGEEGWAGSGGPPLVLSIGCFLLPCK